MRQFPPSNFVPVAREGQCVCGKGGKRECERAIEQVCDSGVIVGIERVCDSGY